MPIPSGPSRRLCIAAGVGNNHRLLEQRHRLVRVVRRQPGPAQIAKRGCLAVTVADLAGDGQGLGVQVDGPPVLA